ncbi:hypothetical protein [Microscilla marina]|uniref:Uncharacterized protein n=1 Tax=Microscilla marina ATCC 23134 TaxID=313606 RepID=A1ZE71_MICM2|nr:hypothetical protein [Microscilla marina]EAY31379.1 hypothetical protein M23134_04212 [Microscilla marina ATCC 23134]
MENIHQNQLEHQAAQKWQEYAQGVAKLHSTQKKHSVQVFWASYEQLLAKAHQRQLKQQQIQATPPVAVVQTQQTAVITTAEHAYLPWVKLMVPYWDKLPLKLQYSEQMVTPLQAEQEGCVNVTKWLGLFLISLAAVITFFFAYYLVSIVCVAILITIFSVKDPGTTRRVVPTLYHSYEFSPDYITYEKKAVYQNSQLKPRVRQLQIPYKTIGYIYTEEQGVRIQPKSGTKWVDSDRKSHSHLMIDQRIVAFNQVASFIRDVINANYANWMKQP